MSYEVQRIYTDNPFVDELVYYTKLLSIGTILKNEQQALKYETLETLKKYDIFRLSKEGKAKFDLFDSYPAEVLQKAGCNIALIPDYINDKNKIPESRRNSVVNNMMEYYIDNYIETNDYYRMLMGLPPMGYEDIYVTDWNVPDEVSIDLSVPVHKMTIEDINILRKYKIDKEIISEDPINRKFINYIGLNLDNYTIRKAPRFAVLYVPSIDNSSIRDMYIDKLEVFRLYTLRTVYSEAYVYNSDYYDSFISAFIVLQSMINIITRVQEFVARKEIFDIRVVQYLFEMNGVDFFENIPLKYQIRLVKNLHTLLKVKSTRKCMLEICSLFGFSNITIFKYYLLRDRNINAETKEYEKEYKTLLTEDGKSIIEEDYDKNYSLKFFKLPLDADVDSFIREKSNYVDYDELTYGDESWDGGLEHSEIKSQILAKEFNYTRTKYISIETLYDITKISIQQAYFFNILYDDVFLEDLIKVNIPFIDPNEQFRVADLFTFLNVLSYIYYGIADDIMETQSKILYINGFNFKADLAELSSYISYYAYKNTENTETKLKTLLNKYNIPKNSLLSMNQLMDLFINNLEVRDALVEGMYNADNKRIYDIYKKLYESLMEIQYTTEYYKNPETGDLYRDIDGNATLSEFLKYRCPTLYDIIETIKYGFEDDESKTQYIANIIDNIVYVLEEYIDTDEYAGLFHRLPVVSAEAVKLYVSQVINFFKSFKITFLGLNTVYVIDDKLDGIIKLIDDITLQLNFTKPDFIHIYEKISGMKCNFTKEDKIKIEEMIYKEIHTLLTLHYNEIDLTRDDYSIKSILNKIDFHSIYENIAYVLSRHDIKDNYYTYENLNNKSIFNKSDIMIKLESIIKEISTFSIIHSNEDSTLNDKSVYKNINFNINDKLNMRDEISIQPIY